MKKLQEYYDAQTEEYGATDITTILYGEESFWSKHLTFILEAAFVLGLMLVWPHFDKYEGYAIFEMGIGNFFLIMGMIWGIATVFSFWDLTHKGKSIAVAGFILIFGLCLDTWGLRSALIASGIWALIAGRIGCFFEGSFGIPARFMLILGIACVGLGLICPFTTPTHKELSDEHTRPYNWYWNEKQGNNFVE